jgi:hypothetical protein
MLAQTSSPAVASTLLKEVGHGEHVRTEGRQHDRRVTTMNRIEQGRGTEVEIPDGNRL